MNNLEIMTNKWVTEKSILWKNFLREEEISQSVDVQTKKVTNFRALKCDNLLRGKYIGVIRSSNGVLDIW